jgi:hypothetical protein
MNRIQTNAGKLATSLNTRELQAACPPAARAHTTVGRALPRRPIFPPEEREVENFQMPAKPLTENSVGVTYM